MANQIITQGYVGENKIITQGYSIAERIIVPPPDGSGSSQKYPVQVKPKYKLPPALLAALASYLKFKVTT